MLMKLWNKKAINYKNKYLVLYTISSTASMDICAGT
jgi:hypothetical protein